LRLHLIQAAVERENEARRLRLQREFINGEIGVDVAFGFEHRQVLIEEERHLRPGQGQRSLEHTAPLVWQSDGLQGTAAQCPD
jgi:hypothetical protein